MKLNRRERNMRFFGRPEHAITEERWRGVTDGVGRAVKCHRRRIGCRQSSSTVEKAPIYLFQCVRPGCYQMMSDRFTYGFDLWVCSYLVVVFCCRSCTEDRGRNSNSTHSQMHRVATNCLGPKQTTDAETVGRHEHYGAPRLRLPTAHMHW